MTRQQKRPAWLSPSSMVLVLAGGTLGAGLRDQISLALPDGAGFPWTTLAINLTGAFALGLLLDGLARSGPDSGWRRTARLTVGTGVLGGFTTYSTFVLQTVRLGGNGRMATALVYDLVSLALGFAVALVATTLVRPRPQPQPVAR